MKSALCLCLLVSCCGLLNPRRRFSTRLPRISRPGITMPPSADFSSASREAPPHSCLQLRASHSLPYASRRSPLARPACIAFELGQGAASESRACLSQAGSARAGFAAFGASPSDFMHMQARQLARGLPCLHRPNSSPPSAISRNCGAPLLTTRGFDPAGVCLSEETRPREGPIFETDVFHSVGLGTVRQVKL